MNKAGWIVLALAGGTVAALYLWARPQPLPAAGASAAGAPAGPQAGNLDFFEFEIANGTIRGPAAFVAKLGQRVTLRVRSDVADELHVHGYDLSAPLPAGEWVALTFVAAHAGRFEVELHGSHRELGALEVQPR